jgi:hypothetical protein
MPGSRAYAANCGPRRTNARHSSSYTLVLHVLQDQALLSWPLPGLRPVRDDHVRVRQRVAVRASLGRGDAAVRIRPELHPELLEHLFAGPGWLS